jgi:four helix bundle protein
VNAEVGTRSAEKERKMGDAMATRSDLQARTKAFAVRVIRLVEALPNTLTARVIGKQILRSGTSVGANYRAAHRAKSNADFISKMGTVEEELDETAYWMELMVEVDLVPQKRLAALLGEADELLAIMVASIKTAKKRR